MRLKARATGNLSTTNLKLDSQLKQQAEYQKPTTPGGDSDSAIRRIQIRAEAVKHLTRLPKVDSPQRTQRTQRKEIIYGEKILCTLW